MNTTLMKTFLKQNYFAVVGASNNPSKVFLIILLFLILFELFEDEKIVIVNIEGMIIN